MKTNIVRLCSLALFAGFLCCQTPAEAQLRGAIDAIKKKDKGDEDKAQKGKKKGKKTLADRFDDILNAQFDPATPVVNQDWSKGEEVKDAGKISGDYYMWIPLTNRLEKVFVRWNDYTFKSESKNFPGMQVVISIWRKDSPSDKPYYRNVLYPFENDLMTLEGLMASNDQGQSAYTHLALERDMWVLRLPYMKTADYQWRKLHYNYDKNAPKTNEDLERYTEFLEKEGGTMMYIVKDPKQLEGFNFEKLESVLNTKYELRSFDAKFQAAMSGKQAKPKATTSGELFTNKKWFNAAKEGVTKDLGVGKKVIYGYAPNAGWQTVTNRSTGRITHQVATYWFVCERSPEVMKKEAKGKYYLMGGNLKRTYNGSGYDEPFYNGFSFANQDLTEEEFQEFMKVAVK